MKFKKLNSNLLGYPTACLSILLFALSGCSGSNEEAEPGYIKLYNASTNAPGIYLTVDENLDTDEDDEIEVTYSPVAYTSVGANNALEPDQYFIELAWQNEESLERSDLEIIYEDRVQIDSDKIKFITLTGDVRTPEVLTFDIDVLDDEEDDDNDLFNIRLLNINSEIQSVDLYMSKDNETFNEAELVGTVNYQNLSDNIKIEQDQYIFYITLPGSTDVIFTSVDVSYTFVTQYIIVLRENIGVGSSPFSIDNIGINGVTALDDVNAEAKYSFYNGIGETEYLEGYQGAIDIEVRNQVTVEGLEQGQFSASTITSNGDYAFNVISSDTDASFIIGALLSLKENADSTVFLYGKDEPIDEDGDGDYDENDDGIIDGYETIIKSLTLTKSDSTSIYDHGIRVINLVVGNEDFSRVTFYFVLNDELISTAENRLSVLEENSGLISLLNNTYDVYAVVTVDGTDIIVDQQVLELNEESKELYLIFEETPSTSSGYEMTFLNQQKND